MNEETCRRRGQINAIKGLISKYLATSLAQHWLVRKNISCSWGLVLGLLCLTFQIFGWWGAWSSGGKGWGEAAGEAGMVRVMSESHWESLNKDYFPGRIEKIFQYTECYFCLWGKIKGRVRNWESWVRVFIYAARWRKVFMQIQNFSRDLKKGRERCW